MTLPAEVPICTKMSDGTDAPLLIERLMAAVWMMGNVDTDEDKARWWRTFGATWDEVAQRGVEAQAWADREAHRHE